MTGLVKFSFVDKIRTFSGECIRRWLTYATLSRGPTYNIKINAIFFIILYQILLSNYSPPSQFLADLLVRLCRYKSNVGMTDTVSVFGHLLLMILSV
jgi:hypothetical protein